MSVSEVDDRRAIRDLIENWAVWRDALMWDRFRTVWHDDGRMMATWFQGTADEFIKVSQHGYERGAMSWVTEEDAHVQEFVDPPFVARIAPGQDLRAMLRAGEIDAAIALAIEPAAVRTVIPDADTVAAEWSR